MGFIYFIATWREYGQHFKITHEKWRQLKVKNISNTEE